MSYKLPTYSPFSYNTGICFHTNMCSWYPGTTRKQMIDYSQSRLEKVVKDFKMVRIYGFLTAGWLSTGTLDPCAQAFINVLQANSDVEGVIGTTDDTKGWFQTQANVDTWVASLKKNMGSAISQIKTILICNEINAHGFTAADINTIFCNFKNNSNFMALNIPLSVSFSNLPVQSGDALSDQLVAAVVNNWDKSWNSNYPYVFIDPYPDAPGIGNGAGVYDWQDKVQAYYATKHPNIEIFIGETGAEGAANDTASEPIIQDIFTTLEAQYTANSQTVPTFMFEAIDETLKGGNPIQSHMGIYTDTAAAKGSSITVKPNVSLPNWLGIKN